MKLSKILMSGALVAALAFGVMGCKDVRQKMMMMNSKHFPEVTTTTVLISRMKAMMSTELTTQQHLSTLELFARLQ